MERKLDILVVEDDPDIRIIVGIALCLAEGINLHFATSGAEALALIDSIDGIDLVLLEPRLPDMMGTELLDRMHRQHGHGTPLVVLTADAFPRAIDAYLAAGAAEVILKPFNPLALARQVIRHAREGLTHARQ